MSHIKCPKCKKGQTVVVDSRSSPNALCRRRRKCPKCNHRFSTLEIDKSTWDKIINIINTLPNFELYSQDIKNLKQQLLDLKNNHAAEQNYQEPL
jgi:transcriptional regulator NrdR family protein